MLDFELWIWLAWNSVVCHDKIARQCVVVINGAHMI